jgi:cytoskeletal protein RodZ
MAMVSLGEELKREREMREISLREISDATKISMRILEAIEHDNDNYKLLPGGIFNRNFIRAYAEFIGLDPEHAVVKYQQQAIQMPTPDELPPFMMNAGKAKDTSPPPPQSKNLMFVAAGIILLLIIVFIIWRLTKGDTASESSFNMERPSIESASV